MLVFLNRGAREARPAHRDERRHTVRAYRRAAGRAAPHAEMRIVGPDDVEMPRGEVGEVVVRGGHVMLGYWNRSTETAQALRGGWMHTGDGGFIDQDGYFHLIDRIKDMIITGGENVYSVEVENVLCQHPAVATAAVIGVPDDIWGERVHAVGVPAAGQTVTLDASASFCKEWIAGYNTPRSLDLVEELPLTPAGKVLKRELRRPYWEEHERAIHTDRPAATAGLSPTLSLRPPRLPSGIGATNWH